MVIFYCVMCVENSLLVMLWWWSGRARRPATLAAAAAAAFLAGIAFMLLYYRYFHVRRLGYMLGENQQGTNSTNASLQNKNGSKLDQTDNAAIPGVFNCRFSNPVNSANGRKKKKPTTFVPPPAAPATAFWRRPLPAHNHHVSVGGSSENEGSSVGSRVNIQQKLQEKKQKQLAELRVIEEEIKQGKLAKTTPVAAEEIYSSLQRQPIPRAKTHAEPAWPSIELTHSYQNYPIVPHNCNYSYTDIKPEFFPEQKRFENRTFYDNSSNIQATRTPVRSPNYLERNYDANCSSPRNIVNTTPNYVDSNFEGSDKRIQNGIYSEGQIGEYSGYCENNYKYSDKEEYSAALQHALTTVQSIDTIRNNYECGQYTQNCERFPYPALGAKKMEQMRKMQRCRTPEILLAPHYLEGCSRQVCCHWGAPYPNKRKEEGAVGSSGEESSPDGPARDTPRPPSDIDSQISLPRSYTLPREFRYWRRRPRLRDSHVPSNNSSDGDVDSGDNESDRRSNCSATSQIQGPTYADFAYQRPDIMPRQEPQYDYDRRPRRAFRKPGPKPETKL